MKKKQLQLKAVVHYEQILHDIMDQVPVSSFLSSPVATDANQTQENQDLRITATSSLFINQNGLGVGISSFSKTQKE